LPTTTVGPIHFEDFSGDQFERLCFAYVLRRPELRDVDWYGQLGADRGRDIIASNENGTAHIFQCANYQRLTKAKIAKDIAKIAAGARSRGANLTIIAGGRVSAKLRDTLRDTAAASRFSAATVWSGPEIEERLRLDAPDLLKRFTDGIPFPELPAELKRFAASASNESDDAIIQSLAIAFDRPAFRTPFSAESSLFRFRAAIAETISTLNTGSTPSGSVLASKNDIRDLNLRRRVDKLVELLAHLRASFDGLIKSGEIKGCGCQNEDCSVFMLSPHAIHTMDRERRKIMDEVHSLQPAFDPSFYAMV
jgi:hypothetical protein